MEIDADLICQILTRIYGKTRARFEVEAAKRGVTIHELAAGAIAEALRDRKADGNGRH